MPTACSNSSQGFGETHPHNPKVVSDMTALHHIHEASILYNLGQRSKLDIQRPYTFMVRRDAEARKEGGREGGREGKREEGRFGPVSSDFLLSGQRRFCMHVLRGKHAYLSLPG